MGLIWVSYFTFFAPQTPPPEQVPAEQTQQPQRLAPRRRRAPRTAGGAGHHGPRGGAGAVAAGAHRVAAHLRFHRAQGRPDRRCGADRLSCHRRSGGAPMSFCCRRPARPMPILRSPAGAAARAASRLPDHDTLWQADSDVLTPGTPVTLTWDNGAGLQFTRIYRARCRLHVHGHRSRRKQRHGAGRRCTPIARVSRTGTPKLEGFYILHEGFVGIIQNELKEADYSELQEKGKRECDSPGGWVGITDKYWLAALVAPDKQPITARYRHNLRAQCRCLSGGFCAPAVTAAPGGSAEATSRIFAGAKEVKLLDRYARASEERGFFGKSGHRCGRKARRQCRAEVRFRRRLGLVPLPHQADLLGARLAVRCRRQFRHRHPAADGHRQARCSSRSPTSPTRR